ncbi:sterile alpha motif domain-containing protein 1-like [Myotis daubentonii]|uniref:sterile alpha motif domain-containing protein 1-like n=1 Tax=Myotis daubentonii TaxID=98922 RepID=UPI0028737433|nr:sterile alpha motif domain-containing protein 1-like [Myotis daubentonii]
MCKVSVSKWVHGGEGRAAQCGLRKRAGAGRGAGSRGNSVPKEEGPPTSGIDPGSPLPGRWPRTGVLAASPTLRDLSKQSRAKPPTCRGPRAPRRRQRADRLRRGARLRPGRGTHCSGGWGSGWAQPRAAPRPLPARALGLGRGSARRRRSPPPGSPEAPRPPEREVEPSPRRPRRRESWRRGSSRRGGAARGASSSSISSSFLNITW